MDDHRWQNTIRSNQWIEAYEPNDIIVRSPSVVRLVSCSYQLGRGADDTVHQSGDNNEWIYLSALYGDSWIRFVVLVKPFIIHLTFSNREPIVLLSLTISKYMLRCIFRLSYPEGFLLTRQDILTSPWYKGCFVGWIGTWIRLCLLFDPTSSVS